ncbi:hypothetical protein ACIRU8_02960 [Streptomyces sp. NPDC101175]|uniref:hypothetical protein n=1 Tax=Streptomyces sp. NPDC101175 TaxID=3366123 RepID=UPI003838CBB3
MSTQLPCVCSGLRICLFHYSALHPHEKRAAQMRTGVKGSWLTTDRVVTGRG